MATSLRIRALTVATNRTQHTFDFATPLTLITGDVGMGKSSLIMLVKYALGGDAKLTPAVREHATYVELSVQAGGSSITLRRRISSEANVVEVLEPGSHVVDQILPVNPTPADGPSISRLLLERLEIPVVRVSSSRLGINARTVPITFNDVFAYCYVQAKDIDRQVVGHLDQYRNRQRIATFELLFGLTDLDLAASTQRRGKVREEMQRLSNDIEAIEQFIRNAGYSDPGTLRTDRLRLLSQLDDSESRLEAVRREVAALLERERDRQTALAAAASDVAATREKADLAAATVRGREAALAQLRLDSAKANRVGRAAHSLAPFEFMTCPRCMQSLSGRSIEADQCLLCLQAVQSMDLQLDVPDESLTRFQNQIVETEQLLLLDENNHAEALRLAAQASLHLARLHREFDSATSSVVSPRMDAVAQLSSEAEALRQRVRENDRAAALWKQVGQLRERLVALRREDRALLVDIRERQGRLVSRSDLVGELTSLFAEEVTRLGIPIDGEPRIDEKTYLPMIGDTDFASLQASGGGASTALNVAYHITLLSYAANRNNVLLPSLLIVDSPRKAIGNTPADVELGRRIYRRFMVLSETLPAQIVVADNGVPADIVGRTPLVQLTRERSTVPGVTNTGVGLGTRVEDV